MEQHPIPQQITSYQFRLVGDMTLKQFFQLAGGIVVALIFYWLPLHPLIKWPLIFFFTILGVAMAFLPFEDRPLENWIIAFFRSIYSPTVYGWKKSAAEPKFFADESTDSPALSPQVDPKLNAYLAEPETQKPIFAKSLDSFEKTFLSGVTSLFGSGGDMPKVQAPVGVQPSVVETPMPQKLAGEQMVSSLNIPQATPADTTPLATKGLAGAQGAQFSQIAATPSPATVPNTLSGQVLDSQGKIVEAAILEIRDASGRPVRALRTNKLGHFNVVTPLTSGPYEIFTEKEGFEFDPVRFDAVGELIPPILVKATK